MTSGELPRWWEDPEESHFDFGEEHPLFRQKPNYGMPLFGKNQVGEVGGERHEGLDLRKTVQEAAERQAAKEVMERQAARERAHQRFVQKQREHLEGRIRSVRELAGELRQQGELSGLRDIADLIDGTCDNWEFQLTELVKQRDPQAAFAMTLSLEASIHDVEGFIKQHREPAPEEGQHEPAPKTKASRLQQARDFRDLLVSIRHGLWALIGELLTPREWTLKGNMKVPMLADAGIEIKFGPRRG